VSLTITGAPAGLSATEDRLRTALATGELDLPLPGSGETRRRWARLAAWGRADLPFARLAEGHTDAAAILGEAGRRPAPGDLYGVWAARPGGRGAHLQETPDGTLVHGTVRFCSGARMLDRALVVAPDGDGPPVLVEVGVRSARPDPGSWRTAGMAASDTLDVTFGAAPVERVVGPPGWYTARRGFIAGGGGVAAVWWGGAAGLLDRARRHLPAEPDTHQLAHLGELTALVEAADALLDRVAAAVDDPGRPDLDLPVARLRAVVERVVREVLDRVPRMLGAGPMSGDADLARMHADLGVYVRQHHGERDHSALGAAELRGHRA
jgi:hypothetical protein